ncbi:DsbA family protein [Aquicoccus porphyridii]|uniref:DsbA family protein n=1 Tax=Aquicoccus porphyridii TaxID=1852029 RepID=A0A5A9Z800_9RHOB|nr:DsbA family protein [Aquicoccus porphyridii]KAA0913278.1 DsbA family protein [Aquicoccus porphyridii]RAI52293.1 DsbA family protein [Rhodobacteraceae bacterium AsT-22]
MIRILALTLAAILAWQTPAIAQTAEEDAAVIEMTMGPEDAAVTLIEYASFTCPHCASFHQNQFKEIKADYIDTGKIRFVYRDVYFDRIGLWASMLARCEESRFFGVTGLLYEKQKEWLNSNDPVQVAGNLRRLGKVAGLDEDRIEACLSDADKATVLVNWFEENRKADDINSTPSLVINGTKYSNMAYSEIKTILDEELGEE